MQKQDIIAKAERFVETCPDNIITEGIALSDAMLGLKLFEAPIFAFGAADDEYFLRLQEPGVIGPHLMLPWEWLPEAKTVISFFLPFTDAVKQGNSRNMAWPSEEWLHGRIEGQAFIAKLCRYLSKELQQAGHQALAPSLDARFWANTGFANTKAPQGENPVLYTSNWSERHTAFVCGLGTFGLSKGLITPKGMAGRIGSIVTDLALQPDQRAYRETYEYCSMCGSCVNNCPVKAISIESGKRHDVCSPFLDKTMAKHRPRYGCGKCQVRVPCENGIPKQSLAGK